MGAGNAHIAAELGAHVVLVVDGSSSSGGMEGAFDELHMNRLLFMVRYNIHTHTERERERVSLLFLLSTLVWWLVKEKMTDDEIYSY